MTYDVPGKGEIEIAVREIFSEALQKNTKQCAKALVPIMVVGSVDEPQATYSPFEDLEMTELCEFVTQMKQGITSLTNKKAISRLKALIYCHILEAGLPLVVIWNLLNVLDNKEPRWPMSTITAKGKTQILIRPEERIAEIRKLSLLKGMRIGLVLKHLWCKELRNCFSHSQYAIFESGQLSGSEVMSPLTKTAYPSLAGKGNPFYFTAEQLDAFYTGASTYLDAFIDLYWQLRKKYHRT